MVNGWSFDFFKFDRSVLARPWDKGFQVYYVFCKGNSSVQLLVRCSVEFVVRRILPRTVHVVRTDAGRWSFFLLAFLNDLRRVSHLGFFCELAIHGLVLGPIAFEILVLSWARHPVFFLLNIFAKTHAFFSIRNAHRNFFEEHLIAGQVIQPNPKSLDFPSRGNHVRHTNIARGTVF